MTIMLQVDGVDYENFSSANVEIRLDALTNTFSFEASSQGGKPLPFKGGESCRVIVDGESVLNGSIELVEVSYSADSHEISVRGRDKTADIQDSTLDEIDDLRGEGLTLKGLIEKVISQLGVDINVIEETETAAFNDAEDVSSPEPGENAFEFIEKWARKRQVLLTSNGDGNLVITQSSGKNSNGFLQNVIGSDSNNILSGEVSYDTTGRYNVYKFVSSLNFVALNNGGDTPISDIVNQSSDRVIDNGVRRGRQLFVVSEGSFSSEQDQLRAEWEANIRKAKGRVYSVVVHGYRDQSNDLWAVNTLVKVVDVLAGINGRMLINSIVFFLDEEGGEQTLMTLLESNAYTLSLEDPDSESLGDELFS